MKVLISKETELLPENYCLCCEERRLKADLEPRPLKNIPISFFNDSKSQTLFKKDLPINICTWCDGPLFEILEERYAPKNK